MTKDAEKLLKYIVDKLNNDNKTEVSIEINDLMDIPNIKIAKINCLRS